MKGIELCTHVLDNSVRVVSNDTCLYAMLRTSYVTLWTQFVHQNCHVYTVCVNLTGITRLVDLFRLIFSNYRLDPALIRPGRVDVKKCIDYASHHQLVQMFQRFFPEQPIIKSHLFADQVFNTNNAISIAQVQGYFMMFKSDPDAALESIDKI